MLDLSFYKNLFNKYFINKKNRKENMKNRKENMKNRKENMENRKENMENQNNLSWVLFAFDLIIYTILSFILYILTCNIYWYSSRSFTERYIKNDYTINQLLPSFEFEVFDNKEADIDKVKMDSLSDDESRYIISDFYLPKRDTNDVVENFSPDENLQQKGIFTLREYEDKDIQNTRPLRKHGMPYSFGEKLTGDYTTSDRCMSLYQWYFKPGEDYTDGCNQHGIKYHEKSWWYKFSYRIKDFFINLVAESYIFNRYILRSVLNSFNIVNKTFAEYTGLFYCFVLSLILFLPYALNIPIFRISRYILLFALSVIGYICYFGLFGWITNSKSSSRWTQGLFWLFFPIGATAITILSTIQLIQFELSFTIYPFFLRGKEILNIMLNKDFKEGFILLFGLSIILAGIKNLDSKIYSTMIGAFVIIMIYNIWSIRNRRREKLK